MNYKEQIEELLADPQKLLQKKPFYRGTTTKMIPRVFSTDVELNGTIEATLPYLMKKPVAQDRFIQELDPMSHDVLFDENIPHITMKLDTGGYVEVKYQKMAVPFQRLIRDKHVLHLCGNPMQFTLINTNPTEKQNKNFVTFKQYWNLRNMDGMRTKMVSAQKSVGDAGLLFYFDRYGRIKARLLSYEDGFVLCPHNDENGDRILESVYYHSEDTDYIDSYDDTYMYRYKRTFTGDSVNDGVWQLEPPVAHGFSEIPLVTKRGKVAWDSVQNIIEVYEVIYNIFLVVQKRHGWGILYIKGNVEDKGRTIAGAVVLNDRSVEGNGSAEFKQAPTPEGMLDTLKLMKQTIQIGSGCTIILPEDVSLSGDTSGVAVEITLSLDNETARQGVIDWQNVADKMCRLFKEGLAKELVNKGENLTAITDFQDLSINAQFKIWQPRNDTEYNNMLLALKGGGLISEETGIERNTESSPDEKMRREKEKEEALLQEEKKLSLQNNVNANNKSGNGNGNANNSNNNNNG